MRNLVFILILVMAAAVSGQVRLPANAALTEATSGSQPFTYQGKLTLNSAPANGAYDFKIYLCDQPDPVVEAVEKCPASREIDAVSVTSGIFTLHLDFDSGIFTLF